MFVAACFPQIVRGYPSRYTQVNANAVRKRTKRAMRITCPLFAAIDPIAARVHTPASRRRFAYGIVPTSLSIARSMSSGALVVPR